MRLTRIITSFFGAGLLKPAPGTWGTAAALPVGYVLHGIGGATLLAVAIVIGFRVGIWATQHEERITNSHDASEIVIDEAVGIWITLLPVSIGLGHAGVDPWLFPWPGWVSAFVLFRLFDIWKPGPVGWADRQPGALGVMLDDVIAGVFAAIGVALLAGISHGVLEL